MKIKLECAKIMKTNLNNFQNKRGSERPTTKLESNYIIACELL